MNGLGVPCKQCGKLLYWKPSEEGKNLPYEATGERHRCPNWNRQAVPQPVPVTPAEQPPVPRYDVPADVADTQRLTREIARLATAVEMLADEVRAMRRAAQ